MGEKDVAEKNLTSRNTVFADIFNALVFGGRQVVKPEDLEDVRARSPWLGASGKLGELERDVVKIWKKGGGVILSLMGIENQSEYDPDMALRMFAYDGLSYREQLKLGDGTRRYPVISLVIYYGSSPWGGGLLLSDVVTFPEGEEETLAPFFNDYKLNLIELRNLSPETIALFRSDFRAVANVISTMARKRPLSELDFSEIEDCSSVLALLALMSGDKRFDAIKEEWLRKPKERTMDDLFDYYIKDWFQKGKEEGFVTGEQVGIAKGEQIGIAKGEQIGIVKGVAQERAELARNLKNMGMDASFIAQAVKVDVAQVQTWLGESVM